jgi:hypothetical protein
MSKTGYTTIGGEPGDLITDILDEIFGDDEPPKGGGTTMTLGGKHE